MKSGTEWSNPLYKRLEYAAPMTLHTLFAAAFLVAVNPNMPLMAQGLDSDTAVESIIGSEVQTGEASAEADAERVVTAIENSLETTQEVRRRFNLDEVQIVVLSDIDGADGVVADAVDENIDMIRDLRIAIEGSAMFFHAIDSRQILLDNVIALEFDGDDVTIFAIGGGAVQQ